CPRKFKRAEHLKRHENTHTGIRSFRCRICDNNKSFGRHDNYQEHYKTHVEKT
ncbi:hypothetical protein BCR34DRAFT_445711, partial [Clohesyomyces aquaticus]